MRVLWLKTELLHPLDKGGRIRTYHMLRELKQRCHITYLTLDDGRAAPDAVTLADEYCHELERIPFHTTFKDSSVSDKIESIVFAERIPCPRNQVPVNRVVDSPA